MSEKYDKELSIYLLLKDLQQNEGKLEIITTAQIADKKKKEMLNYIKNES